MARLNEATGYEPIHIYFDDSTGDYYYYNGEEYIKIGNKPLEIGDRGHEDVLKAEEEARKKQIEKERAEIQAKKDAGEEISEEEEEALEDETDEERAERLRNIKALFDDEEAKEDALGETSKKVNRELARKKVGDRTQSYSSPIQKFEESLKMFVAKQVREVRTSSWSRPNMSYEGTGIIRKGRRNEKNPNIPKINVYFDQSGSWGAADIKVGEEAIGVLNNYVKRGEVKIEVFYFANAISTTPQSDPNNTLRGGGTSAGPEILEHIRSTKPDNVIIMTDDDIRLAGRVYYPYDEDGYRDYDNGIPCTPVSVPGAVWYLFRGRSDQDVMDYIKGKRLSKSFMI